jgi:predicted aldo/keto reductase-like oxidoreductase
MQKRRLGKTGLELSLLGFGGFHLVEAASEDVTRLLNAYLDRGGNYIETAAGYGDGRSEIKIARAVGSRRSEYYLATKCHLRGRDEAQALIDRSLANLRTDHVDVLFMHAVQTDQDLDQVLDGAIGAAERSRAAGKLRFIAISGHGRQPVMHRAIERYPFDVLMTGFNYLDRFNYPDVELKLLPAALERGVGALAMKPFADGYLYRSWRQALRYTLSLPVACVVAGMNTMDQLERDLEVAEQFRPMTDSEREELIRTAPELGDYVCRRCGKCAVDGLDPQRYFLLEGLYDRQMDDRRLGDTAQYALRERLRFWFAQRDEARREYAALPLKIDPERSYRHLNAACPYGIDIDRKLRVVHEKLGQDGFIF